MISLPILFCYVIPLFILFVFSYPTHAHELKLKGKMIKFVYKMLFLLEVTLTKIKMEKFLSKQDNIFNTRFKHKIGPEVSATYWLS